VGAYWVNTEGLFAAYKSVPQRGQNCAAVGIPELQYLHFDDAIGATAIGDGWKIGATGRTLAFTVLATLTGRSAVVARHFRGFAVPT
jgi:hypothetical protein